MHNYAPLSLEKSKVLFVLLQVVQDERVAAGALEDAVLGVLGLRRGGVLFFEVAGAVWRWKVNGRCCIRVL